jgi:hypothetical protein
MLANCKKTSLKFFKLMQNLLKNHIKKQTRSSGFHLNASARNVITMMETVFILMADIVSGHD